jgi:ABC-2 type transport system ATP-binding protein
MTGEELVRFNRPFFATWSETLATKCIRRLEIPMQRPFKKLSLGNRTKICLLMALAQGAELLILDEPTSGLDPVMIDQLWQLVIEDHVSEGRTVFLASHQLADVERVADWIGIIDHDGFCWKPASMTFVQNTAASTLPAVLCRHRKLSE